MHTWRGIGILVIFATIGEKENRAGRRNAYKEDARSSKERSKREISILASTVLPVFTDKFR